MAIRFVDVAARRAQLVSTLDGLSANFQGTNVAPPGRTGVIGSQLQGLSANLQGVFTGAPNRTGQIITTMAGITALVSGTTTAPGPVWTSGQISLNLQSGTPFSLDLTTLCTGASFFMLVSGSLPPGLSMSGPKRNLIAGTPTVTGTFNIICEANDSSALAVKFPGVENPISQGAAWQCGGADGAQWTNLQTLAVTGGGACTPTIIMDNAPFGRYSDAIAHIRPSVRAFTANQIVSAIVYRQAGYTAGASGNHEIELLLRFTISNGDAHGYEVLWGIRGYLAVVRWNGPNGQFTPILDPGVGSIPPPQDGDAMTAGIIGNVITVWRNGVIVPGFAAVDVSSVGGAIWQSGQPGMGGWPADPGAVANAMGLRQWQADNQ